MKFLNELVQIITKNKIRSIPLLGKTTERPAKPTRINEFYDKLCERSFSSDEEAADHFFNAAPTDSRYKKLKSNLKGRLINTLFFIDVKQASYNDFQRAYYSCCKDWAAAKILFRRSARLAGINICHKVYKLSLKYEFTELVVDTSRILRLHYGARVGDAKKFDQYNAVFKEHEKIWIAENHAEELYGSLILNYVNSKAAKEAVHESAIRYYEESLKGYMASYTTSKIHLLGNMIRVIASMGVHNYEETIEICKEAIHFFENKAFEYKMALNTFLHQQMVCHTQLRQFEEGKQIAERCNQILTVGHHNWFTNQELYFMLSLHTGNYQQAYIIYEEVIGNNRFQYLSTTLQETWKIYEAYIFYLIDLKRIEVEEKDKKSYTFKMGKFLNEVPIFSKDKRGYNVPIIVVQILFMITRKKYDAAIDRIEAIEKYCSRYLRKDDAFRSNCFIKMLLQIPISSFHKAGVIRRAEKYLEKLKAVPLEMAQQSHEIEIIPYETLWEYVLESLDMRFH